MVTAFLFGETKCITAEDALTPGSLAAMAEHGCLPLTLLSRRLSGDWGDMSARNAKTNENALRYGNRVMSNYVIAPDVTVWIITEADRSSTAFPLPSEY